ncbi:MAG: hypothetical protein KDA44_02455 [Planctomycetales bacterium]|nr:hypothetical protein [Planctomycetales bacterium]
MRDAFRAVQEPDPCDKLFDVKQRARLSWNVESGRFVAAPLPSKVVQRSLVGTRLTAPRAY